MSLSCEASARPLAVAGPKILFMQLKKDLGFKGLGLQKINLDFSLFSTEKIRVIKQQQQKNLFSQQAL